ncbi:MAG TPA: pyridoxal phosphate-dependent aminotransferase [Candidatus Acidoferrales bacterium]|jgi:aspartate/methionine/tyrosine aminotransferase|nr:pyridoxal phosphate-dependent aminotransferase [Candidatus Acidoferrales bacterium]
MFSQRTNWNLEENAYTRALHRHREAGKRVLDLTASNPTTCGFHYDEAAILDALRDPAALRYEPEPKGTAEGRAAVARYYAEKGASGIDPENLILTTGTSEAYSFLFRLLCEPGDEVLIAHPSYPLFDFLATIQDVKLRAFQFVYDHGWQIDFHSLRQALGARTRAIVVIHPNNPTGHFAGAAEAEELTAICAKHDLALIVDEVFLDYELKAASARKRRHGTFASNAAALTFVLSGLSKIAALPQMKLAWIAASGPAAVVRESIARLEVIADTYLSLNTPLQRALPALLGEREGMQRQIRERTERNLEELDAQLARQKSVSRLEVEGGWYAVLRVPAVQSDEELAIRLLEERGVLAHPGHFYDFAEQGYLVISLLTPGEEFRAGAGELLACAAAL